MNVFDLYEKLDSLTESEALDVFYHLRSRHGWQGSVWDEADLADMWAECRLEEEQPWFAVRDNVLSGRGFTRWFSEYIVEKGNEYLADWIIDLDDEGKEKQ